MLKTLLVIGLVVFSGWLLVDGTASPPPVPTPSASSPAPAQQAAPAASGTAEPTPPGQAADGEGLQTGGFDPANPPAGAPDAAEVRQAFAQAAGYVEAINSYGYGDTHLNDFLARAKPYLTESFYQEWLEIAALADDVSADTTAWVHYQATRTRHTARTGTPTVTRWTATTLELAVPYQTADLPPGATVPDASVQRYARVQLVNTGGAWLVQHATTDF